MGIKLQCGDIITIPKGCRAIVKDRSVVIEEEEKVQEFKDGDILVTITGKSIHNAFIYKSTDKDGFHSYYVGIDACKQLFISTSPSNRWDNSNLSYATEEEKQLLFDKMKEQGLKWNAEEKRVETIRWRAKNKESYYFLNTSLTEASVIEANDAFDKELWDIFNYFRTSEQVEEAAKRVKEVLRNYHEEIGE